MRSPLLALALTSALAGCSTAAFPASQFDDEDDEPDARAGSPFDAAPPPMLRDAGPSAPRDAGPPTPPARDAGLPIPPSLFDSGIPWPGDTSASCKLHNPRGCARVMSPMQPCVMDEPEHCLLPEPTGGASLLRMCPVGLATAPVTVTRVQCPHDCAREIPSSFEALDIGDCASRPVTDCSAFPTDQLAVDLALERAALACGLTTHHLALIFNEQGCARALFGREIRDPTIPCIGKHLNAVRFSCVPACAIANSDL